MQIIISGLIFGCVYGLAGLGVVLIYKTTGVVNFAQGEMAMITTFVSFLFLSSLNLPYLVSFFLALAFAAILGIVIYQVFMKRIQNQSHIFQMVMTLGLFLILNGVAGLIWGHHPTSYPEAVQGAPFQIGSVFVTPNELFVVGLTAVLMLLFYFFFKYSKVGLAMRASSQDITAAELMGVKVSTVFLSIWAIGAILGGVAGMMTAPITFLNINMMFTVLVMAFFLSSDIQFFYVVVLITLLIIWVMNNIVKSGLGRAFVAIRDSEVAAQANGIHIAFNKTMMFVISAFFTGIAGGLYAYWIGFVSPDDFSIVTSLMLLAMIVVGGMASIPGAIIGAVLFTIIPHFTNAFVGITNIVIGLAVVLVLFFRPKGIVSLFDFAKKPHSKQEPSEPASASASVKGVARDVNL